jgi:hypothetical protein
MDFEELKYIGRGDFVAGVPARDLSAAEVNQHGKAFLVRTGLYQELTKHYKAPAKKSYHAEPEALKEIVTWQTE